MLCILKRQQGRLGFVLTSMELKWKKKKKNVHPRSPKDCSQDKRIKPISCICPLTCFQESLILFGTCRSGLWSDVVNIWMTRLSSCSSLKLDKNLAGQSPASVWLHTELQNMNKCVFTITISISRICQSLSNSMSVRITIIFKCCPIPPLWCEFFTWAIFPSLVKMAKVGSHGLTPEWVEAAVLEEDIKLFRNIFP